MKLPLIVSVILAITSVIILVFIDFSDPREQNTFQIEELAEADAEEQARQLESLFSKPALPKGHETELLEWLFSTENEAGIRLLINNAKKTERLPHHLSETIFALIRKQDSAAAVTALQVSRRLFPNDPEVLAMAGIVAYLGGRGEEARRLLEQAGTWQKTNTKADFYLGGILIQSETVADKARGKTLLMRVASLQNPDFSEPAALMLLTRTDVPMLDEEKLTLLEDLKRMDTFRENNPNLNSTVIRILANTAAQVDPDLAVELIQSLLNHEETMFSDQIGLIRLLQSIDNFEAAGELLAEIGETREATGTTEENFDLLRVQAFNELATGAEEKALPKVRKLIEANPDDPLLHELFAKALSFDLSIDFQRKFLPLYLELPVINPRLSLVLLERLVSVAPLRQEEWVDYAAREILPKDPLLTGQWMIGQESADKTIKAIEGMADPLSAPMQMALLDAYLSREDGEAAQAALDSAKDVLRAVHAEFYQARISALMGDLEKAQEHWTAAHNAALGSNSFTMMKNLGFLALQLDQPVNALQSLYAAFTAGLPFSPREAGSLIDLTLAYGNLRQSMRVAEYLLETYPDELSYTNNLAYFKFLANEDTEDFVERMRQLVEDYEDIVEFRMTLALGLIKAGRNNEALRLLQSRNINIDDITLRGKLIYAAVLAANGQQLAAQSMIQSLALDGLMPEERALVESL